MLLKAASLDRAATAHRDNFHRLLMATRDLTDARPLFDELPDDVVPYMFPLVLNDPAQQHLELSQLGMPMYRWEDFDTDRCPVSSRYRTALIQIPVHQDLKDSEIESMIGMLRRVLAAGR